MTKQEVEQKIKDILMKDKRFIGATIEIKAVYGFGYKMIVE